MLDIADPLQPRNLRGWIDVSLKPPAWSSDLDLPHGTRLSMGLDMTSISERSHVG